MTLRKGFTLVEYILYIGISAVLLVALLQGTLLIFETRETLAQPHPVQEELRFATRRLTLAIRAAISIDTVASVFQSDDGVLSLTMSGSAVTPTMFSLSGSAIMMNEGISPAIALTSSRIVVETLRFENLSAPNTAGTVKIRIDARPTSTGQTLSLETSVSLRR